MSDSKTEARERVRAIRSELGDPDSRRHCQQLATFLEKAIPVGAYVVVFDAMPGEVDLSALMTSHPHPDQRYAVTRTPDFGFDLTIHPVGGPTERHHYGFDQPLEGSAQVADFGIGAVLVPALAFDARGARLGRGKGYYDRFLERLPEQTLRIGITGDVVVDVVPTESHDVAMTHLAGTFGVLPVPVPAQHIEHQLT